jgi:hypothetical protein
MLILYLEFSFSGELVSTSYAQEDSTTATATATATAAATPSS